MANGAGISRPRKYLLLAFVVLVVAVSFVLVFDTTPTPAPLCSMVGQGYAVYVRVVSDNSSRPVAGARVTGSEFNVCPKQNGSVYTDSQAIPVMITPSNGTVYLSPVWAEYSITVQYSSHTYSFTAQIAPTRVLNATLSVPSGMVDVTSNNP